MDQQAILAKPYSWQMEQWNHLVLLLAKERLPHALLVEGAEGIGKLQIALSLSSLLLCQSPNELGACGICRSCMLNKSHTHPDLLLIEPEEKSKVIKVDQIRRLTDFVSKTAQQGGRKIIVLNPAESMNINAANALLKSLEEPTPNTYLVLVSHQGSKLLPTIRSRCQILECHTPDIDQSSEWLSGYVSEAQTGKLLRLADNRPIAALDLMNSGAMDVRESLIEDLKNLVMCKSPVVKVSQKWSKDELETVLFWLNCWLSDMVRWMPTRDISRIRDVEQEPFYRLCCEQGQYEDLFQLADNVMQASSQLKGASNPNKQLLLENVFLSWLNWFKP